MPFPDWLINALERHWYGHLACLLEAVCSSLCLWFLSCAWFTQHQLSKWFFMESCLNAESTEPNLSWQLQRTPADQMIWRQLEQLGQPVPFRIHTISTILSILLWFNKHWFTPGVQSFNWTCCLFLYKCHWFQNMLQVHPVQQTAYNRIQHPLITLPLFLLTPTLFLLFLPWQQQATVQERRFQVPFVASLSHFPFSSCYISGQD